jgi:predicted small secreted protein
MYPIHIHSVRSQNASSRPLRFTALLAAASLIAAAATTSCSTTKGFGQDVEKTGDKIQDAASRASR